MKLTDAQTKVLNAIANGEDIPFIGRKRFDIVKALKNKGLLTQVRGALTKQGRELIESKEKAKTSAPKGSIPVMDAYGEIIVGYYKPYHDKELGINLVKRYVNVEGEPVEDGNSLNEKNAITKIRQSYRKHNTTTADA